MNLASVIAGALLLVVQASAKEDSLLSKLEAKLLESTFALGRSQIFAAELTPECRKIALNNLEVALTNAMTCDGTYEIMSDVGEILEQALNSTSYFIEDLNTLFNGIPSCLENYSWYNFIGMALCFAEEFKPTMEASKHVNNFNEYYFGTVEKIRQFFKCIHSNKTRTDATVKKIVHAASLCSKPKVANIASTSK